MEERWHVTVNELITVFRDALIALIPSLEQARIPWRDSEAYDDFDKIARTLFETYVLSALRWGLPDPEQHVHVPPWNLHGGSYRGSDWIEVVPEAEVRGGHHLALIGFSSRISPYDTVQAQPLDGVGEVQGDSIQLPFDGAQFRFQWHQGNHIWLAVEALDVQA
ncbi:hypothetical protein [Deinococcus humi]|uniref:Uncharacterized protein n=1 Tax=Deinococcus humi TaxID=662880 RepID=A0A7W8K0A8_9DEIO|nr:hypothetical protein [Deinococcus humi]MBB5366143.1 hypothetical protein [Deinococcus humi]GGO40280.1 hypothetical protein GCM10008949_49610 [Deinococcus humi]